MGIDNILDQGKNIQELLQRATNEILSVSSEMRVKTTVATEERQQPEWSYPRQCIIIRAQSDFDTLVNFQGRVTDICEHIFGNTIAKDGEPQYVVNYDKKINTIDILYPILGKMPIDVA
ncbi:MAG: hypothetical protein WCK26_01630 [Candidatus Saccharibacteria bacterium]